MKRASRNKPIEGAADILWIHYINRVAAAIRSIPRFIFSAKHDSINYDEYYWRLLLSMKEHDGLRIGQTVYFRRNENNQYYWENGGPYRQIKLNFENRHRTRYIVSAFISISGTMGLNLGGTADSIYVALADPGNRPVRLGKETGGLELVTNEGKPIPLLSEQSKSMPVVTTIFLFPTFELVTVDGDGAIHPACG